MEHTVFLCFDKMQTSLKNEEDCFALNVHLIFEHLLLLILYHEQWSLWSIRIGSFVSIKKSSSSVSELFDEDDKCF